MSTLNAPGSVRGYSTNLKLVITIAFQDRISEYKDAGEWLRKHQIRIISK